MNNKITLAFMGDSMIGGEMINYASRHNIGLLDGFKHINTYISDVDILVLNLEGPIFSGPNIRPDVTSIHSNHPEILGLFRNKLRIFNLANNHIMDYREEGLGKTLRLLREHGIYFLGAGRNVDEADKELIVEQKGLKIAFLAYTSNEPFVGAVIATEGQAGSASFDNLDRITKKISYLRNIADIICISMHWGREHFIYPNPDQVKAAHILVEAGADIIIGHHPHVVQGVENYRGALIAYSLGNFYLPPVRSTTGRIEPRKAGGKEFVMLKLTRGRSGYAAMKMVGGMMQEDFTLKPYNETEQINFLANLKKISEPLCSKDYAKYWKRYKVRRDKELEREAFVEAVRKLVNIPLKELVQTLSFADVKRNLMRLLRIVSKAILNYLD